jgi:arsenate reductase
MIAGTMDGHDGSASWDRRSGRRSIVMPGRKRVLFVCMHNSARSQMAEGFLRALYGDRYEAHSAGVEVSGVNPHAVRAMAEAGIDILGHRSKSINEYRGTKFDVVVTVCDQARDTCPFFPSSGERIHAGFEDPAMAGGTEEEVMAAFRRARDGIREWVVREFGPARLD